MSSSGYYLDNDHDMSLNGFDYETGRLNTNYAIMSFPDDSSTIANIIDEYSLFYLYWMESRSKHQLSHDVHWDIISSSPAYHAWSGLACPFGKPV